MHRPPASPCTFPSRTPCTCHRWAPCTRRCTRSLRWRRFLHSRAHRCTHAGGHRQTHTREKMTCSGVSQRSVISQLHRPLHEVNGSSVSITMLNVVVWRRHNALSLVKRACVTAHERLRQIPMLGGLPVSSPCVSTWSPVIITWSPQALLSRTGCLLYTSPSPRDLSTSRMPSSA